MRREEEINLVSTFLPFGVKDDIGIEQKKWRYLSGDGDMFVVYARGILEKLQVASPCWLLPRHVS